MEKKEIIATVCAEIEKKFVFLNNEEDMKLFHEQFVEELKNVYPFTTEEKKDILSKFEACYFSRLKCLIENRKREVVNNFLLFVKNWKA